MKWYKIFNSEKEASDRVPVNKAIIISFEKSKICLAHTKSGWYAIEDTCPHLGESLCKGTINYLDEIVCPWHSYRYHLAMGSEGENRGRDAVTFPVELRSNGLFLGIYKS